MSWLPVAKTEERRGARPWRPAVLASVELTDLRYLVIDEIIGLTVGLVLSEWPRVDERGRLRFGGHSQLLGAEADLLQRFLREHRLPRELAERPLRIGDSFAVEVVPEALPTFEGKEADPRRLEPIVDPAKWFRPPVYDVTREARDAAKLSFYAAVTPTLDPDEARELAPLTDG